MSFKTAPHLEAYVILITETSGVSRVIFEKGQFVKGKGVLLPRCRRLCQSLHRKKKAEEINTERKKRASITVSNLRG